MELILLALLAGASLIWTAALAMQVGDLKDQVRREVTAGLDGQLDAMQSFMKATIKFMDAQNVINDNNTAVFQRSLKALETLEKLGRR